MDEQEAATTAGRRDEDGSPSQSVGLADYCRGEQRSGSGRVGLASMIISVVIVAWGFSGLRRPYGSSVLLALFVFLTLMGGGFGHIPFFVIVWAYSTRMRKPLPRTVRLVPRGVQPALAASWPALVAGASLLFLAGLEVSVFGVGTLVTDAHRLLWIDWTILLASLLCIDVAYLGAMLRDAGLYVTAQPNVLHREG